MQTSRQTADIRIGGRDFEGTQRGVCNALECIRGVEAVCIEPLKRQITVTYDPLRVRTQQFETAVRVMGGEVVSLTVSPREEVAIALSGSPALDRGPT